MTSKKVGRPPVQGSPVSFRIWQELMPIVELGATLQARSISRTHPKRRLPSPNNVLWIRALIEFATAHRNDIEESTQRAAMTEAAKTEAEMVKISILLPVEHRIWLRQFECFTQALDWTIDLNRNAAVNLMVMLHGEALNKSLARDDL